MVFEEFLKCRICESKVKNLPFDNDRTDATTILQIVHTNVNGNHPLGYKNKTYFVTFVDNYSDLALTYPIRTQIGLSH